MGPPGGGRNAVTPRLTRHFNYLSFTEMEDSSKKKIFATILGSWMCESLRILLWFLHEFSVIKALILYFTTSTNVVEPKRCELHPMLGGGGKKGKWELTFLTYLHKRSRTTNGSHPIYTIYFGSICPMRKRGQGDFFKEGIRYFVHHWIYPPPLEYQFHTFPAHVPLLPACLPTLEQFASSSGSPPPFWSGGSKMAASSMLCLMPNALLQQQNSHFLS